MWANIWPVAYIAHLAQSLLEPCADVIVSAAARRLILVGGGGAPQVQKFGGGGAARRWQPKEFFRRFPKKLCSTPKIV